MLSKFLFFYVLTAGVSYAELVCVDQVGSCVAIDEFQKGDAMKLIKRGGVQECQPVEPHFVGEPDKLKVIYSEKIFGYADNSGKMGDAIKVMKECK